MTAGVITVASYNMHKAVGTDRRRDPARTLAVLREIDADIIALQEADQRFGIRSALISAHYLEEHSPWVALPVGVRTHSMGWHGNAILVRKDAVVGACEAIHLPTIEPRGAVMAEVRVNAMPLRIVGMHLDLSGLQRRRQARAIIAHVAASAAKMPTVMMGDLNEWRRTAGCLRDFSRDFAIAETGPSFHARRPVARLDRILVSREWRVADCGVHSSVLARSASDHLPIWARLELAE